MIQPEQNRVIGMTSCSDKTVIFYESPHRILKTLQQLSAAKTGPVEVVIGRELTKKFEEILRGPLEKVLEQLNSRPSIKGEFVVLLACQNIT